MQSSATYTTKSVADIERPEVRVTGPIDAESLRRTPSDIWSTRCSLPLSLDRNLCVQDNGKEMETAMSAACIERLILLSSKARSWRAPDDETVDLTEPRFESFCMANIRSL